MKISLLSARRAVTALVLAAGAAGAAWAQDSSGEPGLEAHASGFFLNARGDVLTARHAVAECRSLYVVKGSRAAEVSVLALSKELDLAVLRTPLKPYLSATFAQSAMAGGSVGVFVEAYSVLQRLPDRATLLSNAMTVPGGEGLQLMSDVQPGASGSAVLGNSGLLLGTVVERVATSPGASGRTLSRAAASSGAPTGATQVHAVPAARIKQFLTVNGIEFSESDAAQIGPQQSPASRASTLSVGVVCGTAPVSSPTSPAPGHP